MGKGTLMTSSGSYKIRSLSNPVKYPNVTVHGYLVVNCKDYDDPFDGSDTPLVVGTIPRGLRRWDFVRFKYIPQTNYATVQGRAIQECDAPNLVVIRDKPRRKPKLRKGKKTPPKKRLRLRTA